MADTQRDKIQDYIHRIETTARSQGAMDALVGVVQRMHRVGYDIETIKTATGLCADIVNDYIHK